MLHFTNSPGNLAAAAELTVLERQRARLMWEGQKGHDGGSSLIAPSSGFQGLLMMAGGDVFNQPLKTDPDWPELTGFELPGPGFGSCARPGQESPNSNKRKFDKEDDGSRDKKNRGLITEDEEYSKITEQSSNTTATTTHKSKNSSRNKETSAAFTSSKGASDVQKSDFIHVRARRGQATDSHSLAERARREKISERMKYLQDLVPGCNKITGKAGMLDEIINYVQSLQRQVEFLSMKLATVNPVFDLNIDNLLIPKEQQMQMFPPFATSFPAMEMLPEMSNPAAFLQMMNSMQQAVSCPNPETFSDTSWFNQVLANAPTTWDSDIHPQIQRY